ncbi:hypothetical protein JCM6882_004246 [Rhodosporidiobolus microsporus]
MLQVHLLRPSECFPPAPPGESLAPHDSLKPLIELVDDKTRQDVLKYRFLRDARRCLLGRLLARYVLTSRLGAPWPSFAFAKTERGRPFAATTTSPEPLPVDYNVSHDANCVIVASVLPTGEGAAQRVGVDVMQVVNPWVGSSVDEFVGGIGEQLTPAEQRALSSYTDSTGKLRHALALWTLKEAYIKATGDGLHFDLLRLSFRLDFPSSSSSSSALSPSSIGSAQLDGKPLQGWRFSLVELPGAERYWLALAVQDLSGHGAVVHHVSPPDWLHPISLAEVVGAAHSG